MSWHHYYTFFIYFNFVCRTARKAVFHSTANFYEATNGLIFLMIIITYPHINEKKSTLKAKKMTHEYVDLPLHSNIFFSCQDASLCVLFWDAVYFYKYYNTPRLIIIIIFFLLTFYVHNQKFLLSRFF